MSREDWIASITLWRRHGLKLLRAQPARACPGCGGAAGATLFESYDGYPYVECDRCGTWYVPLRVDHALFERYFAVCPQARRFGDYTLAQLDDSAAARADRERFDEHYADFRALLGPRAKKALDIGCGVGNSFDAALREGFEPYGIEVNAQALAAAAERGRRVFPDADNLPREAFDLVTLFESLEHINDVQAVLSLASAALTPEGALAITVPNLNSPIIRSMRADSMQIHGGPAWPGHINLFNPARLAALLAAFDLVVVETVGQYSMNLHELAAYHLGAWRGARDYMAKDEPAFELDGELCDLIAELSPAIAAWEAQCAMAPIVRVIARRKGSSSSLRAARLAALEGQWADIANADAPPAPRGAMLSLVDQTDYRAPNARLEGGQLELTGQPEGRFTYAWTSKPISLAAGARVALRGKLRAGGFSFGLLRQDAWSGLARCARPGLVELILTAPERAAYRLVLSNELPPGAQLDLTVDAVEVIGAGERQLRV
jgi:SAM-dependent methyltransferase